MAKQESSCLAGEEVKIPAVIMEDVRIPKRYWTAETDGFKFAFHTEDLSKNLRQGIGLLILGRNGVGKTYSAIGILKKYIRHFISLRRSLKLLYITAPDVIKAFSPEGGMFDEERSLSEVLYDRDVLVIDDLGQEYRGAGTGYSEQSLRNLLRHRIQNNLVTIFTTNFTKDQLMIQYKEGFMSLLAEGCVPVEMKGDDLRKKRPQE